MTEQHPAPSLELEAFRAEIERQRQEAADQMLEACCEWLEKRGGLEDVTGPLRVVCRPKPPNLKEQAMQALLRLVGCSNTFVSEDTADAAIIHRALEQLPTGDS